MSVSPYSFNASSSGQFCVFITAADLITVFLVKLYINIHLKEETNNLLRVFTLYFIIFYTDELSPHRAVSNLIVMYVLVCC